MVNVNRPNQRTARTASLSQRRWLLTTLAAVVGWALLAVTNGAEQVDSGWAIAIPSPLAKNRTPADPKQELLLRHVFEQTEQLLLQKHLVGGAGGSPATQQGNGPAAPATQADQGHGGLRFAVRQDGVDGWRPASQSVAPLGAAPNSAVATPRLGAPVAAKKGDDEAECDCSGPNRSADASPTAHGPKSSQRSVDPNATRPTQATPDVFDDQIPGTSKTEESSPDLPDETTPEDSAITPLPEDAASAPDENGSTDNSSAKAAAQAPDSPREIEASAPPPLTRQLTSLRTRVRSVLKGYYRKALNSQENDPWEVMHGMLAYGVHSRIHEGGPRGELITSVGWLCYNKPCKGQTLLYVTPSGEVRAKYGVGLQGHLGQLLAMLAQCHVSPDYPIHVGKQEFTINDLIEAEKKTCYPKSELTFKLIALQHYIDLNDKWVNDQGVDWDMPRLVREELAQPIRGAACGGTHRLSGLSLAVKTRLRRGEPLDGEYARAAEFVKKYQQFAFRLQNRDGSLSTSWFRGAGEDDDINRRIKTTGHILEWLCYSLSDEELREPRTIRAVTYLANLMYSNYDNEWEVGPRCHATHALLLYDERVFQPFDKEGTVASYRPVPTVAKKDRPKTLWR